MSDWVRANPHKIAAYTYADYNYGGRPRTDSKKHLLQRRSSQRKLSVSHRNRIADAMQSNKNRSGKARDPKGPLSHEIRARISESMLGKRHSEIAKGRIKEGMKKLWRQRKRSSSGKKT